MKEQWKKLDSDAKLLVNLEEGGSFPIKIELPLSAFAPNNNDCCKRLLTTLRVFVLLAILAILSWTVTILYSNYYYLPSNEFNNEFGKQSFIGNELLNSEENKFAFKNKVYESTTKENESYNFNPESSESEHIKESLVVNPVPSPMISEPLIYNRQNENEQSDLKELVKEQDELSSEFKKLGGKANKITVILTDKEILPIELNGNHLEIDEIPDNKNEDDTFDSLTDINVIKTIEHSAIENVKSDETEAIVSQENINSSDENVNDVIKSLIKDIIFANDFNSENKESDENVQSSSDEKGNDEINNLIELVVKEIVSLSDSEEQTPIESKESDEEVITNHKDHDISNEKVDDLVNTFIKDMFESEEQVSVENEDSDDNRIASHEDNNNSDMRRSELDDPLLTGIVNIFVASDQVSNEDKSSDEKIIASPEEINSSEEKKKINDAMETLFKEIVNTIGVNDHSDDSVDKHENSNSDEVNFESQNQSRSSETSIESREYEQPIVEKEKIDNENTKATEEQMNSEDITRNVENSSIENNINSEETYSTEDPSFTPSYPSMVPFDTTIVAKSLSSILGESDELVFWYYMYKNHPDYESDENKLKFYAAKLLYNTNIEEYHEDMTRIMDLIKGENHADFEKLLDDLEINLQLETLIQYEIDNILMKKAQISRAVFEGTLTLEEAESTLERFNLMNIHRWEQEYYNRLNRILSMIKNEGPGNDEITDINKEINYGTFEDSEEEAYQRYQSILKAMREVGIIDDHTDSVENLSADNYKPKWYNSNEETEGMSSTTIQTEELTHVEENYSVTTELNEQKLMASQESLPQDHYENNDKDIKLENVNVPLEVLSKDESVEEEEEEEEEEVEDEAQGKYRFIPFRLRLPRQRTSMKYMHPVHLGTAYGF